MAKRLNFRRYQVVWNRRWQKYGRLVRRNLMTYVEGYSWTVSTGGPNDCYETWVEKDMRPLLKSERGPSQDKEKV